MIPLVLVILFTLMLLSRNFRGNLSGLLGISTSLILAFIGIFTPYIWNWSRSYGTPGLLPSRFLSANEISTFQYLFFLASLGSLVTGLVFILVSKNNQREIVRRKLDFAPIRNSIFIPAIGTATLISLILGLGKSALTNQGYLEFSGSQTFLRVANALLPAVLISLGFSIRESKFRILNAALFYLIFLIQAGRGSRVILIVPFILFFLYSQKFRNKTRRIWLALALIFVFQILMTLTFSARTSKGGILNLPKLILLGFDESLRTESYFNSFGRTIASLTSWAPTLIASIPQASAQVILRNINPLIGTGSDPLSYSSYGIERLFPYTWIPLSSFGQIYGAFGGLSLVIVVFTLSGIAGLSLIRIGNRNNLSVYSLFSVGTYIFQYPLLFQYSSRIWLRVVWLMLLMTIFHLVLPSRQSNKIK